MFPALVNAQFQPYNGNTAGRTNPASIGAIGIGQFPNGTPPAANLHINQNFLPAAGQIPETFRTQTATGIGTQNWRIFRGNTETFRIGTVASGLNDNVTINASNGRMDLSTANTDSVRIMGGNATTGGYVGIGNVGGGFTPASTVHIHGVAGLVDPVLRLTSPATGPTAGDGFGIGIAFNQQEARPVLFSTQRQNRLT